MLTRYLISVRNIPWTVSHLEFEQYFSAFGNIKRARVIFNKYGLSTGHGFVEFYDKLAMRNALVAAHILEKEKLSVIEGTQYLQETDIQSLVSKYMPTEHAINLTREKHLKKNYIQGRQSDSKENNRTTYTKDRSYESGPPLVQEGSVYKQLLRERR